MVFNAKAYLFDLNGTMIDDMPYHTKAWHDILTNELDCQLSIDELAREMYGKNEEVLKRIFGKNRFTDQEINGLSTRKEKRYQAVYKPHLIAIPGLISFLEKSKLAGIKMGIGSAAVLDNIQFIIEGLSICPFFESIVSAENVQESKPNPETFLKGAEALKILPSDCIVFEDAPKGVEAALNAGMRCIVLTTMHHKDEFTHYSNIIAFASDYNEIMGLLLPESNI
jgi:beta-phosphoglucomutase